MSLFTKACYLPLILFSTYTFAAQVDETKNTETWQKQLWAAANNELQQSGTA